MQKERYQNSGDFIASLNFSTSLLLNTAASLSIHSPYAVYQSVLSRWSCVYRFWLVAT